MEFSILIFVIIAVAAVLSRLKGMHISFGEPSEAKRKLRNPKSSHAPGVAIEADWNYGGGIGAEELTGRGNAIRRTTTQQDTAASDRRQDGEYPLNALLRLATDMGVNDLAARHDEYAHGTPGDYDGHSK